MYLRSQRRAVIFLARRIGRDGQDGGLDGVRARFDAHDLIFILKVRSQVGGHFDLNRSGVRDRAGDHRTADTAPRVVGVADTGPVERIGAQGRSVIGLRAAGDPYGHLSLRHRQRTGHQIHVAEA